MKLRGEILLFACLALCHANNCWNVEGARQGGLTMAGETISATTSVALRSCWLNNPWRATLVVAEIVSIVILSASEGPPYWHVSLHSLPVFEFYEMVQDQKCDVTFRACQAGELR